MQRIFLDGFIVLIAEENMISLDHNLLAAEAGEEPEEVATECLGLPGPGPGDRRNLLGDGEGDPLIVDGARAQELQPGRGGRQGVLEQRENETLKNRCLLISILHLMFRSSAYLEHGHQIADCPHQLHEVKPPGGDDSVEVVELHHEEPGPGGDHEAGDAGAHFQRFYYSTLKLQSCRFSGNPRALQPPPQDSRETTSLPRRPPYFGH